MKNRFIIATLSALLFISPAFATIFLDDVMSQEEQKKTGVSRLTPNQKLLLEQWLNQTFILKSVNSSQATGSLTLSMNMDEGRKLQLSDGSIWEVDPTDIAQSASWVLPASIMISPSNDPEYSSLLINQNSGVSVKAKRIPS